MTQTKDWQREAKDWQLDPKTAPPFPKAAVKALADDQLRRNVRHATNVIQTKRARVAGELAEWQDLRESARQIREHTMANLDAYLLQFEANCTRAGGQVHWARDAAEAQSIVTRLAKEAIAANAPGQNQVIKIKSMTTEEVHLNPALEAAGITPIETDLAELIIQLGHDQPSHIIVPALHKNRHQIRELFRREMDLPDLGDTPEDLTAAARRFLRERFLRVVTAVSGANFLVAENGAVCIVESEGNGRMCLTLPQTLVTIAGIDKVVPRFQDLEVLLQLLPRSATGERMNPYNSLWTGITPGDGPQTFHVILLDNGRTSVLADEAARQTLHCIRCAACMNACPVYRQTGGHAYGSVYAGPIGAILTPQLQQLEHAQTLPFASSLCGACYEVCPVKINIPEVLIHLRARVVEKRAQNPFHILSEETLGFKAAAKLFLHEDAFRAAQKLARLAQRPLEHKDAQKDGTSSEWLRWLPGMAGNWTKSRDLQALPPQTFREWWEETGQHKDSEGPLP